MYQEASRIVEAVYKKTGTTKSMCLNSKWKNKKQMYALVCETLKYSTVIDTILEQTRLLTLEKRLSKNENLARVMVYDFLFGKGSDKSGPMALLTRHKNALQTALARLKVKAGVTRDEDLLTDDVRHAGQTLPRYVRVNTLRSRTDDVIKRLTNEGYKLVDWSETSFRTELERLEKRCFVRDEHVPDLLVFPPGTDLHSHPLYIDGTLVLQDKASCLPAWLLAPPPGAVVVDCCAAPGNKTTHAAALMANSGKILAFDLDPERARVLQTMCDKAGATCVNVHNADFLTLDTSDVMYRDVQYIIVDPSCSGSGIASRLNVLTDDMTSQSEARIESLSKFQTRIVNHALTFPNLRRLVYSTCSVHARENEHVVQQVLARNSEHVVLASVLPTWRHRGLETYDCGEKCLRAGPEDNTNGFFVAVFERKDSCTLSSPIDSSNISSATTINCSTEPIGDDEITNKKRKKRNKKRKRKIVETVSCEKTNSMDTKPSVPDTQDNKSGAKRRIVSKDFSSSVDMTTTDVTDHKGPQLSGVFSAHRDDCDSDDNYGIDRDQMIGDKMTPSPSKHKRRRNKRRKRNKSTPS